MLLLALAILPLACCKTRSPLDLKTLFNGFQYEGSSAASDPTAAAPKPDTEPSAPQPDLAYYFHPNEPAIFRDLATSTLPERLKKQGFQISSAPGVNGGDFVLVDQQTLMFVIGFNKGDCHGAITGLQKMNTTDQRFFVKLQPGC